MNRNAALLLLLAALLVSAAVGAAYDLDDLAARLRDPPAPRPVHVSTHVIINATAPQTPQPAPPQAAAENQTAAENATAIIVPPTAPAGNRTPSAPDETERITALLSGLVRRLREGKFWDVTHAMPEKQRAAGAYFDGNRDYVLINGTENLTFKNVVIIDVNATLTPDAWGALAAKHDPLTGKRFEFAVDASGTLRFYASDDITSLELETAQTFDDGREHKMRAILNLTHAEIIVDGTRAANAVLPNPIAVDSGVPVSVGADAGMLPWMGQAINNYQGIIREVSVRHG